MQAKDVKREILTYIHEKENMGALLITGKWGCGKTFLIKEIANRINNGEEPIAAIGIVSLFGLNSVSDIKKRVNEEYSTFYFGSAMKKVSSFSKKASRIVKDLSEIADSATQDIQPANLFAKGFSKAFSYDIYSFIDVKNKIGKEGKTRPFVLVFDDLERCTSISIEDRLGVLNEYLENKEIKVIILADETKITDEKYSDFKEKIIARTIHLGKSTDDIIHTIINSYKASKPNYNAFLSENESYIINAFNHSGYNNLRTLKACIYGFERVFYVWVENGMPLNDISNQLYSFCAVQYEARAGNYMRLIKPDYLFGTNAPLSKTETQEIEDLKNRAAHISDSSVKQLLIGQAKSIRDDANKRVESKYVSGTFRGFSTALSKWIVEGEWEESQYISELKNKYEIANLLPEERFVRVPFWELQQADIDIGLPASLMNAYSGKLSCDDLISLFNKVHELRKHSGLPESIQIDYPRIEQGFENRMQQIKDKTIVEPTRLTFTDKENIDEEAVPIYKKIERLRYKIDAWENRTELIEWLENSRSINSAPLGMIIDEFDNALYELSVAKFKAESNGGKRELIYVLKNQGFMNYDYSDEDNIEHSIDNFKKLNNDIISYCENCGDTITRILGKIFKEETGIIVSSLQEELTKRREEAVLPDLYSIQL